MSFFKKGRGDGHRQDETSYHGGASGVPYSFSLTFDAGTSLAEAEPESEQPRKPDPDSNGGTGTGPGADVITVPDSSVAVVGWRVWSATSEARPGVVSFRGATWVPGEPLKAVCRKRDASDSIFAMYTAALWGPPSRSKANSPTADDDHDAPSEDCGCGIYGVKDPSALAPDEGRLFGEISLWGKVIEGEKGYRAEYGYPKHFYMGLPDKPDAPELDELLAFADEACPGLRDEIAACSKDYGNIRAELLKPWRKTVLSRLRVARFLAEAYGVPLTVLRAEEVKAVLH